MRKEQPRPDETKLHVVGHCPHCGSPIYGPFYVERDAEKVETKMSCLCYAKRDIKDTMRTT